jgi:hypothetical protein
MADAAPSQPPLPSEDPPAAEAQASTSQPYDESLLKAGLHHTMQSVQLQLSERALVCLQEFFSELRDVDRDNEVQR